MRLLFDQNLSFRLCKLLGDLYPDSSQVGLIGLSEADDLTIWSYAKLHGFTIVTLDADFADLAALLGMPPKVIWLRRGNQSTARVEGILRHHELEIQTFGQDQQAGCLEIY